MPITISWGHFSKRSGAKVDPKQEMNFPKRLSYLDYLTTGTNAHIGSCFFLHTSGCGWPGLS